MIAPPLQAIGRTLIEIFGPAPNSAAWDEATWGQASWALFGWYDITPESMVCKVSWGADDMAGVLTVPAAGAWDITTYDPQRKLDPSNASSPFAVVLHPGRPMRISVVEAGAKYVVRTGLIDEIEYDLREKTGSMRGTDLVPLIVNARVPSAIALEPDLPTTLRARAAWLLGKVGLTKLVPIFDAPALGSNTSFEDGTTDWINSNSSGEISSLKHESARDGEYVGRVKVIVAGPATTGLAPRSGLYIPVIEGERYRVSMWCKRGSAASGRQARLTARGYDDAGAQIEEKNTVVTPTSNTDMEYFEYIYTPTPGMNITKMKASFFIVSGLQDETMDFDLCEVNGPLPYDPPVGPLPEAQQDTDASVWSLIGTSAFDALYALWIDRLGFLRFHPFGDPRDNGFTVGGDDGIPISTIRPHTSIENVYTAVHSHDAAIAPPDDEVHAFSPEAADIYGLITLTRNKPVPSGQAWVDAVLADRAGASLQYETGTLYPRNISELSSILDLGMVDIMHLVADDVEPPLAIDTRVLSGKITLDTGTGVTAEVTGYIPGHEWAALPEPPPPEIEEPPPPDETTTVTRYYDAVKDTRAARTSGGANYGSGTEGELPVGAWQGWRNRSFIDFADIPFTDVVSVDKATLEMDTSDQVNIGFGSSPKVIVKRVTANWNEGTLSSPGSSNATVYPGPAVTGTDQVTAAITRSENAAVAIVMTGIARAWQGGAGQYGVGLFSAGEDSTAYTTEFWSRENATSTKRPRLRLDLTVRI